MYQERDDAAVSILVEMFRNAFSPETNRERALIQWKELDRERAVKIVLDMANRYDEDIEGCDGDELLRYSEGIQCCYRLAYILKFGKFPKNTPGDLLEQANFHTLMNMAKQLYVEPLTWPM